MLYCLFTKIDILQTEEYMIMVRIRRKSSSLWRKIVLFLMMCNIVFAILNPGKYFELADYYYFVLTICFIGFFDLNLKKRLFPDNSIEKYLVLCIFWLIVPFLVALFVIGQVSSAYSQSFILYFLFFYICLKYRFSHFEMRKILNSYVISGLIVGLLIITQHNMYDNIGERFSVQLFDHPMFDPNYLAAFLVFPAIITFSKVIYSTSWRAILYSCVLVTILVGLLMTGSRNGMISFFLGAFFVYKQRFSIKLNFGKILFIIIFLNVVIPLVLNFVPEETYMRLFVNSYDDGSNLQRLNDWSAGLNTFLKNPILGYGFTGEMDAIRYAIGKNLVAHNTYIGLLIQFGIIGFFFFFIGFARLIKDLWAHHDFLLLGLFFAVLQLSLVVSGQVAFFFWIPIIIIVCILNCMNYDKKLTIKDFL